jgi:hypothetical protein
VPDGKERVRVRVVSHVVRMIALKVEAASTSETSVNLYVTTRRNKPEHRYRPDGTEDTPSDLTV